MQIVITAHDFPGVTFRHALVPIHNVHVGPQVGTVAVDLVRGDATTASWTIEVRTDGLDLRGPAVFGKRGDRFLYLTWVDLQPGGPVMFRRAKLAGIDPELLIRAAGGTPLLADVHLTDRHGGPACGRLGPTSLRWSV